MNDYLQYRQRGPLSPLAQIVAGIVGLLIFVGALFLGLVVLGVLVGLAVLVFVSVSIRMWWLRRKLRRADRGDPGQVIIEGEYTVLEERRRRGS